MKKTLCVLLAIMMLALTLLPGCASDQPKEHEPLTMMTANFVYKDLLEGFAEFAPEVKIELTSYSGSNMTAYMRNSLKAGDIPDIYATTYLQGIDQMKNNLIDLSKYGFVNNYTDSMLRAVNVDGGIYLLPAFYSIYGMYYNKTVFEKYGWEVPNSFEELVALYWFPETRPQPCKES